MSGSYSGSSELPSYAAHRTSQTFDPNTPPAPPPKPSSQEVSRQSTPVASGQAPPPTPPNVPRAYSQMAESQQKAQPDQSQTAAVDAERFPDPGPNWLPKILQDKTQQDLAEILNKPELLAALAHSRTTAPPSSAASQEPLQAALSENIKLASHLNEMETRLTHLRASTQSQLLSTHALERQWKQKQTDMDRALSPFSPSSLYQRLGQGVQEQELICRALEESFLDGDGGVATEREVTEWVKRYRDSKKLYYSRRERKERWDEGRVGGWR